MVNLHSRVIGKPQELQSFTNRRMKDLMNGMNTFDV